MTLLGIILYLLLCVIVAKLLQNRAGGFLFMFLFCVFLTPFVVAIGGLFFADKSD